MADETNNQKFSPGNKVAHNWAGEVVPLHQRSDSSLEKLLDQFGRNGPMSDLQRQYHDQISSILVERKAAGVSFADDGVMNHPV